VSKKDKYKNLLTKRDEQEETQTSTQKDIFFDSESSESLPKESPENIEGINKESSRAIRSNGKAINTESNKAINTDVNKGKGLPLAKQKATFELDSDLHTKLKLFSAKNRVRMNDVMESAVQAALENPCQGEAINTEKNKDVNTAKQKTTFEMDPNLHTELKLFAIEQKETMVQVVERALRSYLEQISF